MSGMIECLKCRDSRKPVCVRDFLKKEELWESNGLFTYSLVRGMVEISFTAMWICNPHCARGILLYYRILIWSLCYGKACIVL